MNPINKIKQRYEIGMIDLFFAGRISYLTYQTWICRRVIKIFVKVRSHTKQLKKAQNIDLDFSFVQNTMCVI